MAPNSGCCWKVHQRVTPARPVNSTNAWGCWVRRWELALMWEESSFEMEHNNSKSNGPHYSENLAFCRIMRLAGTIIISSVHIKAFILEFHEMLIAPSFSLWLDTNIRVCFSELLLIFFSWENTFTTSICRLCNILLSFHSMCSHDVCVIFSLDVLYVSLSVLLLCLLCWRSKLQGWLLVQ